MRYCQRKLVFLGGFSCIFENLLVPLQRQRKICDYDNRTRERAEAVGETVCE